MSNPVISEPGDKLIDIWQNFLGLTLTDEQREQLIGELCEYVITFILNNGARDE